MNNPVKKEMKLSEKELKRLVDFFSLLLELDIKDKNKKNRKDPANGNRHE